LPRANCRASAAYRQAAPPSGNHPDCGSPPAGTHREREAGHCDEAPGSLSTWARLHWTPTLRRVGCSRACRAAGECDHQGNGRDDSGCDRLDGRIV
jgi:hypothetical protein